jgi:deazaflavin-dependent oxidoreductase (nitroreductase family)
MSSQRIRTRVEHELDTRSVGLAVWLVRRTRGRITRLWRRRVIVLTTVGRRSGLPRTVPVQLFPIGGEMVVVAANSGLDRPPAWYLNLTAEPRVVGEVDGRRLALRAEHVPDTEAPQLWSRVLAVAPDYERYVRRTGRIPPMVRLVPDDEGDGSPETA